MKGNIIQPASSEIPSGSPDFVAAPARRTVRTIYRLTEGEIDSLGGISSSINIWSLVCTISIGILPFQLDYADELKWPTNSIMIVGFLFLLIGLSVWQIIDRTRQASELKQRVERETEKID